MIERSSLGLDAARAEAVEDELNRLVERRAKEREASRLRAELEAERSKLLGSFSRLRRSGR